MKTKYQKMKEQESKDAKIIETKEDIIEKMAVDYCLSKGVVGIEENQGRYKITLEGGSYYWIQRLSEKNLYKLREAMWE